MPHLRAKALRLARTLPKDDPLRRGLYAVLREGSSGFAPACEDTIGDYLYGIWDELKAIPLEIRRSARNYEEFSKAVEKYDRNLARKLGEAVNGYYEDDYLLEHEGYRESVMESVLEDSLMFLYGRRAR